MNLPRAGHPIYRTVRVGLCMAALTAILSLNASEFDETEIRALCWFLAAVIGLEGLGEASKRFLPHDE